MAVTRICSFSVRGQAIRYGGVAPAPVGDTRRHLIAHFALDNDWTGLAVEAVFTAVGCVRCVALNAAGDCYIPAEVLLAPRRSFRVGLIGRGEEGYRLTTDTAEVRLRRSCVADQTEPIPILPDQGSGDTGSGGEDIPSTPPTADPTAPTLIYTRTATAAGGAGGSLTLTARTAAAASYSLRWADTAGPLADYDPIATLTLVGVGQSATHTFTAHNAIPQGATRIVALNGVGGIAAEAAVPTAARLSGSPTYSFGLMSDTHIDAQWDAGASQSDFSRALAYFNARRVAFNVIAGDITSDGYTADFIKYAALKAESTAPIYACNGNHDVVQDAASDASLWTTYAEPNGRNFTLEQSGDVFIFLGLENDGRTLSASTLTYLENQLAANREKRVFIVEHIYVNPVGNVANLDSTSEGQNSNGTFMRILAEYPGATLITGHSHIEFGLQRLSDNANCALSTVSMCHRIHVPSTAQPRKNDVDDPDTVDYTYKYAAGSQAYLVDVYPECTVYRGIDFEGCASGVGRLLPGAQYIIPRTAAGEATATPPVDDGSFTRVADIPDITMEAGSLEATGVFSSSSNATCQRAYFIPVDAGATSYIVKMPVGMSACRIAYYTEPAEEKGLGSFIEYQTGAFTEATRYWTLTNVTDEVRYMAIKAYTNHVGSIGDVEVSFYGTPAALPDPDPGPEQPEQPDTPTVDEGYTLVSAIPGITMEQGSLEADGSFSSSSNATCQRAYFIPVAADATSYVLKMPIGMSTARVVYYSAADTASGLGTFTEFVDYAFTASTQYWTLTNVTDDVRYMAVKAYTNNVGSIGDIQVSFYGTPAALPDPTPDPEPEEPEVDVGFTRVALVPGITMEQGSLEADGSFSTSSNAGCYRAYFIPVDHSVSSYIVKMPIGMSACRIPFYTDADPAAGTGEYAEFTGYTFTEANRYCTIDNLTEEVKYIAIKAYTNGAGSIGDVMLNFYDAPPQVDPGYMLVSDVPGIVIEEGSLEQDGTQSASLTSTCYRAGFIPVDHTASSFVVKIPIGMSNCRVPYYTGPYPNTGTGGYTELMGTVITAENQYLPLTGITDEVKYVGVRVTTHDVGSVGDVQVSFCGVPES